MRGDARPDGCTAHASRHGKEFAALIGRIFRVVRTPVTLLILLGVLVYGAYWGYTNVHRTGAAARADALRRPDAAKGGSSSPARSTSRCSTAATEGARRRRRALAARQGLQGHRDDEHGRRRSRPDRHRRRRPEGDPEVLLVKTFFKEATVRGRQAGRPLCRRPGRQQVRRVQQEREDHVRGEGQHRLPAVGRSASASAPPPDRPPEPRTVRRRQLRRRRQRASRPPRPARAAGPRPPAAARSASRSAARRRS